jgi:hypothetical protein
MHRLTLIVMITLLAACSNEPDPSGARGVTADETKALDDAAEMLEAPKPAATHVNTAAK